MKESSEKLRRKIDGLREDIKGTFKDLTESAPRPITERLGERQTLLLREPLIKMLRSKRKA